MLLKQKQKQNKTKNKQTNKQTNSVDNFELVNKTGSILG